MHANTCDMHWYAYPLTYIDHIMHYIAQKTHRSLTKQYTIYLYKKTEMHSDEMQHVN